MRRCVDTIKLLVMILHFEHLYTLLQPLDVLLRVLQALVCQLQCIRQLVDGLVRLGQSPLRGHENPRQLGVCVLSCFDHRRDNLVNITLRVQRLLAQDGRLKRFNLAEPCHQLISGGWEKRHVGQ